MVSDRRCHRHADRWPKEGCDDHGPDHDCSLAAAHAEAGDQGRNQNRQQEAGSQPYAFLNVVVEFFGTQSVPTEEGLNPAGWTLFGIQWPDGGDAFIQWRNDGLGRQDDGAKSRPVTQCQLKGVHHSLHVATLNDASQALHATFRRSHPDSTRVSFGNDPGALHILIRNKDQ